MSIKLNALLIATIPLMICIFAFGQFQPVQGQQQDDTKKQEGKQDDDDKIVIPKQGEDAVARRDFMRLKLMYTQVIFEGLTTGDFDKIKNGVKEVQTVTRGSQWVAIDNETYRKLTEEFERAAKRLAEAAESGNIDATAMRYYQMSTSCIDCHKHIRVANYDL